MAGTIYRQRWRLELDGFDAPVEVSTNARDAAAMVMPLDENGRPQLSMGFALEVAHNALVRQGVEGIPEGFGEFLDLVIDADEISEEGPAANGLDPTHAPVSDM